MTEKRGEGVESSDTKADPVLHLITVDLQYSNSSVDVVFTSVWENVLDEWHYHLLTVRPVLRTESVFFVVHEELSESGLGWVLSLSDEKSER